MKLKIYQVDAFADSVFEGNPAAVCPLNDWIDDETMQKIAMENNLSETAFFVKEGNEYRIRWFTPMAEVDLCGHATIASAHIIFTELGFTEKEIRFQSLSGLLKVGIENDLIVLDFPANKPVKAEAPTGLIEGLGKKPTELLKGRDYVAVYNDEDDIIGMKPNFTALAEVNMHGIMITSKGKGVDFVSRFFAPGIGVNEDPVTGSAHTNLIPFWAEKLSKNQLIAKQLSKRGGTVYCEYLGNRVLIKGKAVTYLKGEIVI